MKFEEIYAELEECGTEQNRKIYKQKGAKGELFGVSLDDLQRLKNKISSPDGKKGIDHALAQRLWKTRNIDARTFACMIADSEKMTRNEANKWVSVIQYSVIADYFADKIAQTRFGLDIMYLWIQSPDEYIKRVGFSILNYFACNDDSRSELFFNAFLQKIKQEIQFSPNRAKEAMTNCLISIGSRTKLLRNNVLDVAEFIGPVEIDHGDSSYKTITIEEHLDKVWSKKLTT
jgi:3-methyladenine DNA glycosylase AlkD